jgi:ATP-dependent RNA circularization protein (DNA/RNA ligase family)
MTLTQKFWNLIGAQRTISEQHELLCQASRIIIQQQEDIEELEAQQEDLNAVKLEHMRTMQGMAAGWLINLEKPELDMRDEIAHLERTLAESIAVIEEHLVQ